MERNNKLLQVIGYFGYVGLGVILSTLIFAVLIGIVEAFTNMESDSE